MAATNVPHQHTILRYCQVLQEHLVSSQPGPRMHSRHQFIRRQSNCTSRISLRARYDLVMLQHHGAHSPPRLISTSIISHQLGERQAFRQSSSTNELEPTHPCPASSFLAMSTATTRVIIQRQNGETLADHNLAHGTFGIGRDPEMHWR